jgi:hypothetical protein
MMTHAHPLADDYLRRLDRAARALPRREREELIADIRGHLDAGLPPDAGEAHVRNLLDELGAPEDVVAAASPNRSTARRGAREVIALVLLVSGFPPLLGWLIGVGLLLWSPLWSGRQKLLGILVWPGGYTTLLGIGLVSMSTCGDQSGSPVGVPTECVAAGPSVLTIVASVVLFVAPLVVAAYLYRAAGRRGGA